MWFAIELTVDAVARAVGREPAKCGAKISCRPTAMPFVSERKAYDSGDYRRSCALRASASSCGDPRKQQKAGGDTPHRRRLRQLHRECLRTARTVRAAGYPFIPGFEQAAVRFTPDGGLEIRIGVHSHGQGMETSLAQVAHEILGIPIGAITVVHGDTAITPYSTGTYASRSIAMAGGAVARRRELAETVVRRSRAHLLQ